MKPVKARISNIAMRCPTCETLMLSQQDQKLTCANLDCRSHGIMYEPPTIFLYPERLHEVIGARVR